LELIVDGHGQTVTIRVVGELVASSCAALRDFVIGVVARQPHKVILDMSKTPFIDTSGLGVLVGLRATLRSRGIGLELANPSERVVRVFRLTRLAGVFGVPED
jgi:anti-sigma B factor antagonist